MSFLAPGFLLAAGLAALTVVGLHLLSTRDPRLQPFPTTRFVPEAAVRATVTATMVAPKIGFERRDGPLHVGRVVVVDIGVPPSLVERAAAAAPSADTARGS